MADTAIEWAEKVWNPVHGCKAISPGCAHCYAEPMTARLEAMGQKGYAGLTKPGTGGKKLRVWTGEFREIPDALSIPLRAKKPALWFVNSMSDLFGEGVSNEFIASVFGVMAASPRHTYQVLTKRASRLPEWNAWILDQGEELKAAVGEEPGPKTSAAGSACIHLLGKHYDLGDRRSIEAYENAPWPLPNVWLGVSVEDRKHGLPRLAELRKIPAAVRFLSIEPLLEDLGEINLDGIGWVIVGGESGHGARPFDLAWARSIVAQCKAAGVPCFVKQLGANVFWNGAGEMPPGARKARPRVNGGFEMRLLDKKGGDPSEWPADLRVREMPRAT